MGQPRYEMRFMGFTGRIKKTEEVVIVDNKFGVAEVMTTDGRRDYAHTEDLLRLREKDA